TASPPSRIAWSGSKKGGLAQGPRALEDDPAARVGRNRCTVARRPRRLWLGPSGGPCPQQRRPRRGGRGAAAPAGAPRGDGAAPPQSRRTDLRCRPLSQGQPELLAWAFPLL